MIVFLEVDDWLCVIAALSENILKFDIVAEIVE